MVGFLRALPLLGRWTVLLALLTVCSLPRAWAAVRSDPAYVKCSSNAIALTADGTLLLVVNPNSNTLTLVEWDGHGPPWQKLPDIDHLSARSSAGLAIPRLGNERSRERTSADRRLLPHGRT